MPLPSDNLLGLIYLPPADFIARARSFGADVTGVEEPELKATLALASRAVEAHLGGRTFVPNALFEQHRWRPETRRVSVNQPPVMELVSFAVRYAPGAGLVEYNVADVVVNNQENYLELAALGPADIGSAALVASSPVVEVRYKSYQQVPDSVVAAVGFTAAELLHRALANEMLPAHLTGSKIGSQTLSRSAERPPDVPHIAQMLLRPLQRIAIG